MAPCDHQRENGLPELFLFVERIRMKAWFLPCTYFKLPRAFLYIKFYVPSLVSSNSRNCTINNIFVFLIRDLLTEYSYCGQLAGLFYSLKPTKCGIELSVRGYSSKQHIYLGKILSTIYATRKIFSKDRFEQVKDIHKKGIESAEAEPLKIQAKHLLSHILCPKTFHRSDRLQQLSTVSYEDVLSYADDFLLNHSVECFFFGNLTMRDAENLSNAAVEARKKYLEERVILENLKVDVDPYLEEWFLKSPVERIVVLESALRKDDMEQNTTNDGDILTEGNPSAENIQSKSGCNISTNISANDVSYRSVSEYVHDREDQLSTIEEEKGHHNTGNTTDEDITTGHNTRRNTSFENSTKIEIVLPRSKNRQNLFIVNNEVQSSSCVSFYLQFTQNLPNHSALLEMFNQTIREHLVSSMRYIEALGYVIGCDIRQGNANTTIGLRITVESHYPLPVVHARIEESILSLDEFLSSMSDETFQMGKSARVIGKRELWNNRMIDRAVSLWREIADETYYFNRNQDEIEEIEKITLTHVRDFYNTWIHPAGEERRHLTISIGPDPMLNKLDIMLEGNGEHQVRHWNLKELEIYRNNAKSFPLVSSEVLSRWYQKVFDSEDNTYQPPHSMI
jgi:secreted Zn-dependent insulinase-like peptidase